MNQLEQIRCPSTQMSLRLQAELGLRREASIKIVPARADRGNCLVLKASWNKGGREIMVPIRTSEQRELLDEAKALAKGKSLVAPGYATYVAYLKHFRYECERVGIHGVHGHRHGYAQRRYHELTGWECPARGGPTSKQLTKKQKERDREAREVISHEMGHGREQVTSVGMARQGAESKAFQGGPRAGTVDYGGSSTNASPRVAETPTRHRRVCASDGIATLQCRGSGMVARGPGRGSCLD